MFGNDFPVNRLKKRDVGLKKTRCFGGSRVFFRLLAISKFSNEVILM